MCKWGGWIGERQQSGARHTSSALFEVLEEFGRPGDGVGALESGAEKNIVQWCLGG
jgi:hypothetical protein